MIAETTCETCAFWSPSPTATHHARKGQCRAHAPIVDARGDSPRTIWPLTRAENWCGDHAVPA